MPFECRWLLQQPAWITFDFFSCHRRWAHHTTYFKHFDLEHTGACVLPGVVSGKNGEAGNPHLGTCRTWVATTAGDHRPVTGESKHRGLAGLEGFVK